MSEGPAIGAGPNRSARWPTTGADKAIDTVMAANADDSASRDHENSSASGHGKREHECRTEEHPDTRCGDHAPSWISQAVFVHVRLGPRQTCKWQRATPRITPLKDIPSRNAWTTLAQAAQAVMPAIVVGSARAADNDRVSVLYSHPHGMSEYIVATSDLPDVLLPPGQGVLHADAEALRSNPDRALEWQLLAAGVQSVTSVPASGKEGNVRFWLGMSESGVPADDQVHALERIARESAGLLSSDVVTSASGEHYRRLDQAAALLPALLEVLDVREVFDRLSSISQAALPHDMLTLGLFNDELTTLTLYARAGQNSDLGRTFPQPYPTAVIQTFEFDIIDDRAAYPLERDRPPTTLGLRSSLRLPFRFDGKTVGGIGFHSFEPGKYGSDDIVVARRLADYVGIALSHQRLAEQAKHNEELRARLEKSDLLDDVLASVTSAGELPEVFDKISNATQKVLAHDALVLTALLPDRRHGKVYASKAPEMAFFPEILEVPPSVSENPDWEFDLVPDLQSDPAQRSLTVAQRGYRAVLRVAIRLDHDFVGALSFLSLTPARYGPADVPIARRIADRLAVSFARERGTTLLRRADEATERASRLEARVRALTEELDAHTGYRRVVGESPQWHHVLTQATQVAATETTVLLLGESGTGKEVVARFLHRGSSRKQGPFIALNCAALPEQLLEAELFGYERGAYTGATQSKPGQLEQAAGGTLFLDEVAEMSPSAQAKFLRVLQEREFQRLGGTRVLRTDARVIAATNRDLPRAIAGGQFREDLYYRLNVFAIRLPPLRDRRDDILPLSEAFLTEIGRGLGRPPGGISREARSMLVDYRWPGNVRELRNILERAAILCDGGLITPEHLAFNVAVAPSPSPLADLAADAVAAAPVRSASEGQLQAMERSIIEQALQTARFNKSKAAKALGLSRHQLYIRMQKYGLE
jgi:transcriptional regulator with GAF, ATPase, and Fis domain